MKYAALLVKRTFELPKDEAGKIRTVLSSLPSVGGDVLPLVVEPGTKKETR